MEDRSRLVPPCEAFERHQYLTMIHHAAAFDVDKGKDNQTRLIEDVSRRGRHDLSTPIRVATGYASVWAILCRQFVGQSVGVGHISILVRQNRKGK
jgi:hypothetical protein